MRSGHWLRSMRSCSPNWAALRGVRIGGLVQLTVRVKPAQKPRMGRDPATGEDHDRRQAGERRLARLAREKDALPSGIEGAPSTRRVSRIGDGSVCGDRLAVS